MQASLLNGNNINNYSKKELAKLRNKSFGFVVQYFALLNEYSVFDNIAIPLEYSKVRRKEKKKRIEAIVERLGIGDKLKKYPSQLSGGQQQRVTIARALVNNPDIILADEPTGALDKKTSKEVMEILKEFNSEGKTVIIVTHDEKVSSYCNRIIEIEDGEIKIG